MAIAALGLNHMSAPLALRERLAFAADQVPQALASLKRIVPARHSQASLGAAILSTCNRTELYVSTDDSANVQHELQRWLAEHTGVDARQLAQHGYYLQHDQAVRHAFRVASGLDSMVLGEPQILGQLKDAVRVADQSAALGSTLSRLFQRTFSVAKEVRSSTAISSGGVSMAAATVRIAERIFESISDCRVLLVGAGDMIDLVGTHFAAQHPKQLVVMNRSRERGEALARKLHAHYLPLAELPAQLPMFDIVVSCTASTLPIIGLGAVQRAISARRHKPMLMVDMAVPRDVEAEVGKLSDVYLYTVDDLQSWVQEGMEQRRSAVSQAEAIVNSRVQDFMQWLAKREVVPTIQAIAASSESWRQAEVDRALKLLAAGHAPTEVLEQLSHRLSHKHLHGALASLAEAGTAEQPQLLLSAEKFFLRNDRSLHR